MTNKHQNTIIARSLLCAASVILVSSCSNNTSVTRSTLADLDRGARTTIESDVSIGDKSEEEIKQAYYEYLNTAAKEESSRKDALTRLAQIEQSLSNRLADQKESADYNDDDRYIATLRKTASLLETALNEYPNAKDNDKTLYQLARTYNQLGKNREALDNLKQLVARYPSSSHYAEAQFRIAEDAFLHEDYFASEDAYTEAIVSPDGARFYEKAFFKRGWARYKQELYAESVDDYIEALTLHQFDELDSLDDSEKELFNEYFRAIGLSFSHLDGAKSLQSYFSTITDFRYLYHTYFVIADIYLQQDRYTDSADTLRQFISLYPNSDQLPIAHINIVKVWQDGGLVKQVHNDIEKFYTRFNPSSNYWNSHSNTEVKQKSLAELRSYITGEASFFHSAYQKSRKAVDFNRADLWYNRYLKHFSPYANKDNIHFLYASLLQENKQYAPALKQFELAAFDGNIILNREAAYNSIALSNSLYQSSVGAAQKSYLEKLARATSLYVELYPNRDESVDATINAAQLLFNNSQYNQASYLVSLLPQDVKENQKFTANYIDARSQFELNEFSNSESIYEQLLTSHHLNHAQIKTIEDNLALSIYRQAENFKSLGDFEMATHHFVRISRATPKSEIATTALYDAIALAMQYESWENAIDFIERFKTLYPRNDLTADVTKKLSIAYLNSNQQSKAAREFERIASMEENSETKMAALWQAAELYESRNDVAGAIRSYRNYAHTYKKPFAQNVEAMFKLTQLYETLGDVQKKYFWDRKLSNSTQYATDSEKTERTTFLAAQSAMVLAIESHGRFNKRKLVAPLQENLRAKKQVMQEAIKLYGKASSFGLSDYTTQATYSIGKIYQSFASALMNSERPIGLNTEELEQYEILLEDQAFPFEDKAIELHETNISRTRTGLNNEWLSSSATELKNIFPVRYAREGKIGGYFE